MIKAKAKTNKGNYYDLNKTTIGCNKKEHTCFDETNDYFLIEFEGGGD